MLLGWVNWPADSVQGSTLGPSHQWRGWTVAFENIYFDFLGIWGTLILFSLFIVESPCRTGRTRCWVWEIVLKSSPFLLPCDLQFLPISLVSGVTMWLALDSEMFIELKLAELGLRSHWLLLLPLGLLPSPWKEHAPASTISPSGEAWLKWVSDCKDCPNRLGTNAPWMIAAVTVTSFLTMRLFCLVYICLEGCALSQKLHIIFRFVGINAKLLNRKVVAKCSSPGEWDDVHFILKSEVLRDQDS